MNRQREKLHLLSTVEAVEESGGTEAQALEWAEANGVAQVDGVFCWTPEDLDEFAEYVEAHEPYVCDVCSKETLEDIDGKWIMISVINDVGVDICDECAQSDDKIREGLDRFLEVYRENDEDEDDADAGSNGAPS